MFPLRKKILLIVLVVMLAAIAANTFVGGFLFSTYYSEALQSRAQVLGQTLKSQLDRILRLRIPLDQLTGFDEQCQDIVSKYPDLAYAMVASPAGEILFHNDRSYARTIIKNQRIVNEIKAQKESSFSYEEGGEEYHAIIIPVFGTPGDFAGAVILGFPQKLITDRVHKALAISSGATLLLSLLGVALLIALLNIWVSAPLTKLTRALSRWRPGEAGSDVRVKVTSRDEIGELGRAFNEMLAEEASRKSQAHIKAILDTSPDMIFRFNREGICTFYKPSVYFPTRINESTVGQDLASFTPEDIVAERMRLAQKIWRTRESEEHIYSLTINGERYHRWAIYVYWSQEEIMATVRDVTAHERMEAQLRQAQKMEAVGILAGGIAHEFNNILAAISGFAELALEDAKAGKASPEDVEQVLAGARRAAKLVRQILTFSRKVEPDFRPLDINREVANTANLIKNIIPRMIEIELDLSEEVGPIRGDANQLEQVLLNLAANAKDAMPNGGKLAIKTSVVQVAKETCQVCYNEFSGKYVLLRVSDMGAGMDTQTLEKIFDPFFTTKEVDKGTGLGLSMVFGIVMGHGGHATVASQPGAGTTFNIYLPVTEEDLEVVIEEEADEDVAGGNETILLVDDERAILEIGNKILSGMGYAVLAASSGEEAIETFGKLKDEIDLVLLDVSMPGMGGHRCLQELLTIDPAVKVVIASGYSRDGDLGETLSAGSAAFIPKPFSRGKLLKTVREVLDA